MIVQDINQAKSALIRLQLQRSARNWKNSSLGTRETVIPCQPLAMKPVIVPCQLAANHSALSLPVGRAVEVVHPSINIVPRPSVQESGPPLPSAILQPAATQPTEVHSHASFSISQPAAKQPAEKHCTRFIFLSFSNPEWAATIPTAIAR